jgi:NADH-quinone oxidoreductase subunit M
MDTVDFPWLSAAVVLPAAGALAVALMPRVARGVARMTALVFSLAVLGLVIGIGIGFDVDDADSYQYSERVSWIPQFGVSWALGVDGIALSMIALTAVLVPVCLLAAWTHLGHGRVADPAFLALILVLEALVIGVFAARDLFVFYVFFEAMLIPMYVLIGRYGGPRARAASVQFLVYSLLGGLIMLAGVIAVYLYGPGGETGFLLDDLAALDVPETTGRVLFLSLFIAFAIKAPLWPVHTWLPDAAQQAPPTATVLLTGVLDKVGTFGMLVICLPLFPEASEWAAPVIIALALVSVLYGALLAIAQILRTDGDVLRLIAYTSISHFGFIVLGIFVFTSPGQVGAALYQVNHGLSTAALLLVAGMFAIRRGSSRIADFGGAQRVVPLLAGVFLVAGLSSLALPGLNSFVSEFLVLVGTYSRYQAAAVVATIAVVLAAVYILWTYERMMTGPTREEVREFRDLRPREAFVVAPLLAAILTLGVYPKPVLDILNPPVERTMEQVGTTDPAPVHPVAEGSGR